MYLFVDAWPSSTHIQLKLTRAFGSPTTSSMNRLIDKRAVSDVASGGGNGGGGGVGLTTRVAGEAATGLNHGPMPWLNGAPMLCGYAIWLTFGYALWLYALWLHGC